MLRRNEPGVDVAHLYYGLGQIAERRNEPRRALRYYEALLANAPASFYAGAARLRVDELGRRGDGDLTVAPAQAATDEIYAVRIGVFAKDEAAGAADPYERGGLHVERRAAEDGRVEIFVGSFSTEIQARFFAEELEKKISRSACRREDQMILRAPPYFAVAFIAAIQWSCVADIDDEDLAPGYGGTTVTAAMVDVAAGSFEMGSPPYISGPLLDAFNSGGYDDERPEHSVTLSPYAIDATEAYRTRNTAGACSPGAAPIRRQRPH
ncbi:MAG: formylglycine-generating enzyme family protein [Deltaproteobacteria bacterium]|nr:formylglycine-generating enzyme family protein [Deltaproteobacteria bacterium]